MASLLEDLEAIGEDAEELYDTAVRERLWALADAYLIRQSAPLSVPDDLGMFSAEANQRLKSVLEAHLPRLDHVFRTLGQETEKQRRVSFLNPQLHTEKGSRVDAFFGSP